MGPSPHTDDGVSLRQLFPEATFLGGHDVAATACSGDSRICQAGDVFVAMLGRCHDGHDFYRQAIQCGASAVLSERPLPTGGIPQCIVPDSREAYGHLCHALAGNPSEQIKVIGVTGTLGKTVTACLIAAILESANRRVGLLSTVGYCDGLDLAPTGESTPVPPVAAHWLARMVTAGCTHAVVEVADYGLRQSRLAGMTLDAVCVTNVRKGQGSDAGAWQKRRDLHARIFNHLTLDGLTIINADDPGAAVYLSDMHGPVLTVGMNQPAELTATLLERHLSEQTFLLTAGSETVPVRTSIIGDRHIDNCLTAAAVGLAYGIDLATVASGLEAIRRLPGRMERIECGQPFGVFVDAARSTDGLSVALSTLREVAQRRLICVIDASASNGRETSRWMARAAGSLADLVVVTGSEANGGSAGLRRALQGADQCDVKIVAQRERAIHWALSEAQAGDCVLLAGASDNAYPVGNSDDAVCDDQETARRWLYANAQRDTFACRQ